MGFFLFLYGIHHPHFSHVDPITSLTPCLQDKGSHKLFFLCYFLCVDVTHSISLIQLHIHFQSIFLSCLSLMFYLPDTVWCGVVWCNKNSPCVQVTKESIHTPGGLDKGLATFKPTSHSTSGTIEDPTRNATNGADRTRCFSSSACSRCCCDTLGMRTCGNGC